MTAERSDCIFCKIVVGETPSETVYEDDLVVCIKDIKPASTHHYLILPKCHIDNAKVLQSQEDGETLEHMVKTLSIVSEKLGFDLLETRTGFHWPPFTSISHLHLHIISPVGDMGFFAKLMFLPNSLWFVSIDYVRSRLRSCS